MPASCGGSGEWSATTCGRRKKRSRTVFLPDEVDQKNGITSHMSMKPKWYGGVYLGFLIPYVPKEQRRTELGPEPRRGKLRSAPTGPLHLDRRARVLGQRAGVGESRLGEVGDEQITYHGQGILGAKMCDSQGYIGHLDWPSSARKDLFHCPRRGWR